ncbi:MAG: hypothetical protein RDU89_08510 [bacterium]|nr:hypothetical protein [bacterium]
MEGLVFLIVVYLVMRILTGGLQRVGGLPRGPLPGPPEPLDLEEDVLAPVEPRPGVTSVVPRRRATPAGIRPAPAVPAAPPAATEKPVLLPGWGELTDPRVALHGVVLAEIFGPPRCRRPHRPFSGRAGLPEPPPS